MPLAEDCVDCMGFNTASKSPKLLDSYELLKKNTTQSMQTENRLAVV